MAGSWLHCGYHLTTSIVSPILLSLPYAMGLLGWAGGVMWLALAALVTFYSYNLLSMVLEHHAKLGHRYLRFRDMATHILGELPSLFPSSQTAFQPRILDKENQIFFVLLWKFKIIELTFQSC